MFENFLSKIKSTQNTLETDTLKTITQYFIENVLTEPNTSIFFTKNQGKYSAITWFEFYKKVRNLSYALLDFDIKPQDKIAVISHTKLEWTITDISSFALSAITVPIYPSLTAKETYELIKHSESKIVFIEDSYQLEKLLELGSEYESLKTIVLFENNKNLPLDNKTFLFNELLKKGEKIANENFKLKNPSEIKNDLIAKKLLNRKPNELFTICYTSGTSGTPKGVMLSFENLDTVIKDVSKVLNEKISKNDKVLSFLPVSHIFGRVENLATFYFSWKIYYAESSTKIFENILEVKPTIIFAVPFIFERVYTKIQKHIESLNYLEKYLLEHAIQKSLKSLKDNEFLNPKKQAEIFLYKKVFFEKITQNIFGGKLKFCISGGAPLSKEIAEFFYVLGIPILEGYGLTETCAPVTLNTFKNLKLGSVGKPLPETKIKISEDGEILVKSKKVFQGYYKDPIASKNVFTHDGWFLTGDLGKIDSDDYVFITGRKKDLIVLSNGKKVSPQKVESILTTHPMIEQAFVFGDKKPYIVALIVLNKEEVVRFTKEHTVLFSDYNELMKNPKLLRHIEHEIHGLNNSLASYERIRKFKILPLEFKIETGELTPTQKIKRNAVLKSYQEIINKLYLDETL
jgi:long-chain acyl-CoA synthetase